MLGSQVSVDFLCEWRNHSCTHLWPKHLASVFWDILCLEDVGWNPVSAISCASHLISQAWCLYWPDGTWAVEHLEGSLIRDVWVSALCQTRSRSSLLGKVVVMPVVPLASALPSPAQWGSLSTSLLSSYSGFLNVDLKGRGFVISSVPWLEENSLATSLPGLILALPLALTS